MSHPKEAQKEAQTRPAQADTATAQAKKAQSKQSKQSKKARSKKDSAVKELGDYSSQERRKAIEADVQVFIDSGRKIEQVPTGFTNQDPLGGRRHIRLGSSKKS